MGVNNPIWFEGEIETFQTSGASPGSVRWFEGEIISVHNSAAPTAYERAVAGGLPAMAGGMSRQFAGERTAAGAI